MSRKRKRSIGYTMVTLLAALLLAVAVLLPALILGGDDARAASAAELNYVRAALDDFFTTQYTSGNEGGFLVDADTTPGACAAGTLRGKLDSNCDGTYLGAGDDAANSPILVDVLTGGSGGIIPGTSLITTWNATTTFNTASTLNTTAIATLVTNHEAAGFSTDIISYCATGHTESVAAGGMGAISYAGGYGGTTTPKVLDLKWGRWGWGTNSRTYSNVGPLAAPDTPPGGQSPATNAQCGSESTAANTRCLAEWATAGITGNGSTTDYSSRQIIDMRQTVTTDSPDGTGSVTYNLPLQSVFDSTGVYDKIDPAGNLVLAGNATQHTSGMVFTGLKMLGYSAAYSSWGLADYNNTIGEQYTGGMSYGLVSAGTAPGTAPWLMDTTAPVISSVVATPTTTGAVITWTTDEPATTRLKWDTDGTPYTNDENDTILKTSHSVTITGQTAPATIYYEVSAYDGYANSDVESEATVDVVEGCQTADDYCYYSTWYDAVAADGWQGDWIDISNLAVGPVEVDVLINNMQVDTNASLGSEETWTPSFPGMMAGPVEVICRDCKPNDKLVVSQRVLFKNTFNEVIMPERADLGTSYKFPWYDNYQPSGMLGDWIMMTNTDPSAAATVDVEVCGSAVSGSPFTIPAGTSYPIQLPYGTTCGPVSVTGQGAEKLLVTQRVLFWDSFNEVIGYKAA